MITSGNAILDFRARSGGRIYQLLTRFEMAREGLRAMGCRDDQKSFILRHFYYGVRLRAKLSFFNCCNH
eukprot:7702321-Karenia_brevis.AAC.1